MSLGGLGAAQNSSHRLGLAGHIYPMLDLQMLKDTLHDLVVEIIATQVIVAVTGDHLDHSLLDAHDRCIERPTAQIVDQDAIALMLRSLLGGGCGGLLVDDANDFEAGNLPGLACGLALGVGKIRWNSDHCLAYGALQLALGNRLEALENDC